MPNMVRTWMLEAMQAKGYSRESLSQETEIDYPRICEYISGARRPRPEKAMLIAEKLGVDWTLFFKEQTAS